MGMFHVFPLLRSPSCFTDFSDKPGAFYAVYGDVFAKVWRGLLTDFLPQSSLISII
jgi:hypothetical protein